MVATHAAWKFGIWCSFNSTPTQTAPSHHCPPVTSTLVWALNASLASCSARRISKTSRARFPITKAMSLRRCSVDSRSSRARNTHQRCQHRVHRAPTNKRKSTWPSASSPTTSEPFRLRLLTVFNLATPTAITCCVVFSVAPCVTVARSDSRAGSSTNSSMSSPRRWAIRSPKSAPVAPSWPTSSAPKKNPLIAHSIKVSPSSKTKPLSLSRAAPSPVPSPSAYTMNRASRSTSRN